MLHILLLILKIAGIILAAILGILILALLIVLFVPFCYQGAAKWDGGQRDLRAQGRISWLFGLVELRFVLRDGNASVKGRIAWKKLGGARAKGRESEPEAAEEEKAKKEKPEEERPVKDESRDRQKEEKHEEEREKDQQGAEKAEEAPEAVPAPAKAAAQAEKAHEEGHEAHGEKGLERGARIEKDAAHDEKEGAQADKGHSKLRRTAEKICRRLQQIIKKIKCTFKKICDKINLITEKKEQIAAFLSNETHKKAFDVVKKECIRLLGSVLPRQFSLSARFGFEDPYHTGQLLAGIAVLYPFLPGDVRVEPDFEERIFRGKAVLRGRLYVASLVFAAFQVLRRRAVRETYRDIRGLLRAKA